MNRSSLAVTTPRPQVEGSASRRRSLSASGPRRTGGTTSSYDRVKRVGDVVIAGAALVLLSPVLVMTAVAVKAKLGGKVLFRQQRAGLHGDVFEVLKFRTMLDLDPERGLVADEDRLTRLGRVLRASSLDELPGLINVVRGDMSLVGPRPLLPEYLKRYSEAQARRHDVLPGLTGMAQISGRNSLTWDDRFDLDLLYLLNRSLLVDLRILLGTIPKVLRREGVTEQGQVTMTIFCGPRRIGGLEIRPCGNDVAGDRPAVSPGRAWQVVERDSGVVVALAGLTVDAEAAAMEIRVLPEATDPDQVRARGVEMLMGLARERGATLGRLAVDGEAPGGAPLPGRLGFHRPSSRVHGAEAVLEADLGRNDL